MTTEFNYYKIHNTNHGFVVKGYGDHPKHSVCYGQTRIVFLESFDTEAEAREAYPQLPRDGTEWGNKWFDRELTCMPTFPPRDFDPADAGERWDDDY